MMHILFCCSNQKKVLQKQIKDWTFEVYLLNGELLYWFPLMESLKMTCARSYAWFLKFLSHREGLDCFSRPKILPKLYKIAVVFPKIVKCRKWIYFDLPKVIKMTSLKIWLSLVMEKQETLNLDSRKLHSKGSIGYSFSGGTDVIT